MRQQEAAPGVERSAGTLSLRRRRFGLCCSTLSAVALLSCSFKCSVVRCCVVASDENLCWTVRVRSASGVCNAHDGISSCDEPRGCCCCCCFLSCAPWLPADHMNGRGRVPMRSGQLFVNKVRRSRTQPSSCTVAFSDTGVGACELLFSSVALSS